jgi:hypothetical protein
VRRRELLIAGAGALLVRPSLAHAGANEGAVLRELLVHERSASVAYKLGGLAPLARQETQHVAALTTELAGVGLGPPPEPRSVTDLEPFAQPVARTGQRSDAIALEERLVAAYSAALPRLPDEKIAMTVATILASHAQHLLILRDHADLNALAAR